MLQFRGNFFANEILTPYSSKIHINNSLWNGAGTCIIHHNKNEDSIFIFYNPYTKNYELPYGKRDIMDSTPKNTAHRETKEETANLFDVKSTLNSKYSITSHNGKENLFVVCLEIPDNNLQSIYRYNLQKIKKNKAPRCWLELAGMTEVFISELLLMDNTFRIKDIYNNLITICKRDGQFIKLMLEKKLHEKTIPIKCYSKTYNGNKLYLQGTINIKSI